MDGGIITRSDAISCATSVGRHMGYAIGVHGSQARDLDLVAVPWVDLAASPDELAEAIGKALPGVVAGSWTDKPHGRVARVIYPKWRWGVDAWYIDLSVAASIDPPGTATMPEREIAALRSAIRRVYEVREQPEKLATAITAAHYCERNWQDAGIGKARSL